MAIDDGVLGTARIEALAGTMGLHAAIPCGLWA
jgi:hypothetical protein